MYFKVEKSLNDFYFIDVENKDTLFLGPNKDIPFAAEGLITFLKLEDGWFFKNELGFKIWYGFHRIGGKHIYRLKHHKPLKIKDIKITLIHSLPYRPFVPARGMKYTRDLTQNTSFTIGRDPLADLVIDSPLLNKKNTRIIYDNNAFWIEDLGSPNGMLINDKKMRSKKLEDGDIIKIPAACFMFYQKKLLWATPKDGVRIDVCHVSKQVTDGLRPTPIKILNDISFTIQAGEFVAIVGGSGAGKTTLLDAITAKRKCTSGSIFYDLNNYYRFQQSYQKIVGYVPQKDIMHEDLTVKKTLYYYSFIKMKHKLTKREISDRIDQVLADVSLTEKKNLKVSKLSGGQKKRVSIAMELMTNPKVLFLDEPTSGLSPDLDYEIMELLYQISRKGRTVIVITHNMENVDRCDKLAFLGVGGRLCYFGPPAKAYTFFKFRKFGPIFSLLASKENSIFYEEQFKSSKEYKKMSMELEDLYKEEEL